jgi:biotin-dependent carboxylase-like uncharacterized protein
MYTTVQDLGRRGYSHLGVSGAGAADAFSLRVANRLVGNDDTRPALEMTARGASLRFETAAAVAIAGAAVEAILNGQPVPMYQTVMAPAGSLLRIGRIGPGWRCYFAVAGGIQTSPVLGSAACDTFSGFGPAPLTTGMRLELGQHPAQAGFYFRNPPSFDGVAQLRVLQGRHADWFTAAAQQSLSIVEFRVLAQSDRSGVRLEGPELKRARQGELPSAGMVPGAVQVPPDGRPIALLSNHGTTGGYPVLAVVITADVPRLAQLGPGAAVRFTIATRGEALEELRLQEQRLQRDIVTADASLLAARALMSLAGRHVSLKLASLDDGTRRIRIRRTD